MSIGDAMSYELVSGLRIDCVVMVRVYFEYSIISLLISPHPHTHLHTLTPHPHTHPTPSQVAAIDQLAIHFAIDSNLLHKDSDEAQRQLSKESDQSDESEGEGDEVGDHVML